MARILIVDDSKTSRKFLRNMLEQAGHEIVAEAVDGAEGVENLKYTDLILQQWILQCQSLVELLQLKK